MLKNSKILRLLNTNDLLKNNAPKKNIKWFLNKPDNAYLKKAIFDNTQFVIDLTDYSIRERIYCIVNNITKVPCCEVCSSNVIFRKDGIYAGSYGTFCSRSCISKGNSTKLKKVNTTLRNYNVENPFQSESIKEKSKLTMLDSYGVQYPLQSEEIKKCYKQTSIINHGFDNPMKSKKVQEKTKITNLKKNNIEYSFQYYDNGEIKNIATIHISHESLLLLNDPQYLKDQHHTKKLTLTRIASILGVNRMTVFNYLTKFNLEIKYYTASMAEMEIVNFIKELFLVGESVEVETSVRTLIPPYELDIYLPKYNIAIEYNGLYWHSEAAGKPARYHLMKTEMCERSGIRLIHIFEDEWRDQRQKCKDTIKHLLGKSSKGVYARNTKIMEIPWKQAKEFLNRYHLLDAGTSGNYRIGAFDSNDNLIGVMVFGLPNNEFSTRSIEMKRFVTNKRNNPGLGSKMFKYAINQKKYDEVIAFVDRRWFTGLFKSHIGFVVIGETEPSVWWTNGISRYHRRFMTKKGLIGMGYASKLSKRIILEHMGYSRIWDSGKFKLQWKSTLT